MVQLWIRKTGEISGLASSIGHHCLHGDFAPAIRQTASHRLSAPNFRIGDQPASFQSFGALGVFRPNEAGRRTTRRFM